MFLEPLQREFKEKFLKRSSLSIGLAFIFQKIVIQTVTRTYLHMCYQHLPEEFADHDSMYFIRNTPGMVPLPNSKEEANETMPNYFEMGILNGHSLVMLEHIIAKVGLLS